MARLPASIATPRLALRVWAEEDVFALSAAIAASREHLVPFMPWAAAEPIGCAARLALVRDWRRAWEDGGDVVYGVFLAGDAIGGCGLHRRSTPDVLEIGYWTHVDHVGRGYATELAQALTTAAFAEPDIDAVEIRHDVANTASGRIPKKLGFVRGPDVPVEIQAPGQLGVQRCWRIERSAWKASA